MKRSIGRIKKSPHPSIPPAFTPRSVHPHDPGLPPAQRAPVHPRRAHVAAHEVAALPEAHLRAAEETHDARLPGRQPRRGTPLLADDDARPKNVIIRRSRNRRRVRPGVSNDPPSPRRRRRLPLALARAASASRSRNFRAALRVLAALTNRTTETHAPATKHAKESVRHARPKKPKPARWSSNERCVATNTSARPPLTPPNRRPLRAFRRRSSPAPSEGSNASPKPSSRSSAPASFPPFVPSFRGSLLRVPGGPGGALVTSPTTVSSVPRGRTRSLRLVPRILNPALASARCARTFPAELRPASASAGAKWSCATVRTQSFAAAASE